MGKWTIKSPLGVTRTVVKVAEFGAVGFTVYAIPSIVEAVRPSAV